MSKIVSRRLKEQFGIDVEFGKELIGIDQDETGATAIVTAQGTQQQIRVKYVVGTDGGKGTSYHIFMYSVRFSLCIFQVLLAN